MTSIHRQIAKNSIIVITILLTTGWQVSTVFGTPAATTGQTIRHPASPATSLRGRQQTVLVKFKADCPPSRIEEINRGMGATVIKVSRAIALWQLRLPDSVTVEEAVRYYQQQPEVVYAEPDVAVGIE